MQYFKTALSYFKSLINRFDILAISEHCLFQEQLGILILSSERAHGGVALIWNNVIDNFVTPLDTIECDQIVGINAHL